MNGFSRGMMKAFGWSATLLAGCVLVGASPCWADEPSTESLKADIQVLKDRLSKLEVRLTETQTLSKETPSPEKKSGAVPTLELPSGLQGLRMSGYADTSYILNLESADIAKGRTNRGRVFDTQPNAFTLNGFNLALEKPLSNEFPIGFRTDLLIGKDAELIHSTGLGTATDPWDLQQAYVTYRAPVGSGLDFKVGKFVTLLGAEVIRSMDNWNFSRSYLFGYAIPFTHTGALVSYPVFGDYGSVTGGVVNGWDNVDENNQFKTMLGSLSLTPIKSVTLGINGITGAERTGDNRNDRSVIDLVTTWQPLEKLTLMGNYDYGHESNLAHGVTGTPGFDSADWQGLALYAKYDLTPKWSLAGRWEWFDDIGNTRLGLTGPGGTLLNRLNVYGTTLTSQWVLHEHLIARLEYRHDDADERVFFHEKSGFLGYQDTISTELIYHF